MQVGRYFFFIDTYLPNGYLANSRVRQVIDGSVYGWGWGKLRPGSNLYKARVLEFMFWSVGVRF